MSIYEYTDYRDFLKSVLAERAERNPRYSLRAWARDCNIGSSTLFGVLSGKTNLSIGTASKIAENLKLKSKFRTYFFDLVLLGKEKNPFIREQILIRIKSNHPKLRSVTDITVDQFRLIADWYHSAILELPFLDNFKTTKYTVARALGIPLTTAELALERLQKLKLIKITEGVATRIDSVIRVRSEVKSEAMRQMYRQMLERASEALDKQTPQERLSRYLTFAINRDSLPRVEAAMAHFFEEIKKISDESHPKNQIYHLLVHSFNLTKAELEN